MGVMHLVCKTSFGNCPYAESTLTLNCSYGGIAKEVVMSRWDEYDRMYERVEAGRQKIEENSRKYRVLGDGHVVRIDDVPFENAVDEEKLSRIDQAMFVIFEQEQKELSSTPVDENKLLELRNDFSILKEVYKSEKDGKHNESGDYIVRKYSKNQSALIPIICPDPCSEVMKDLIEENCKSVAPNLSTSPPAKPSAEISESNEKKKSQKKWWMFWKKRALH